MPRRMKGRFKCLKQKKHTKHAQQMRNLMSYVGIDSFKYLTDLQSSYITCNTNMMVMFSQSETSQVPDEESAVSDSH